MANDNLVLPYAFSITLLASAWSNRSQTITDAAILFGNYDYIVSPEVSQMQQYIAANIKAQNVTTNGQMTFTCVKVPSADIVVNIVRVADQEVSNG